MKLTFEWDEVKAIASFKKHKVSFEEGGGNDGIKYASSVAERPRCAKGGFMKKVISDDRSEINDMKSEYDFSNMKGAVRGKYHKAYRAGHKVVIHRTDGTVATQYFTLEEGAVMLEPDVRKYFTNSESVNKALRSLIEIIPSNTRTLIKRE